MGGSSSSYFFIHLTFVICNILSWFPAILCYGLARVSAGVFGNEGMNLHGNRICAQRSVTFPFFSGYLNSCRPGVYRVNITLTKTMHLG
ncbi:hypothetical protein EV426DRAFT_83559 [Tirmania nivea]|nr:hypothetical protein EV426DRAFT_83559 [Tirmania nivea]